MPDLSEAIETLIALREATREAREAAKDLLREYIATKGLPYRLVRRTPVSKEDPDA